MRIQFASDLHLEFLQNKKVLLEDHFPEPLGEVLLLAGDIAYLNQLDQWGDLLERFSENWDQVFIIPGNHEYYGGADIMDHGFPEMDIALSPNVRYLNNKVVEYKGVEFVCSTLWSHIRPQNAYYIQEFMADFHQINYDGQLLNAEIYNSLHQASRDFLTRAFTSQHPKRVVMTHHLPSESCNSPEFKGSDLTDGFVAQADDLIKMSGAQYWIWGHSHRNLSDFKIGDTTLLSNQFGYAKRKGKNLSEDGLYSRGRCFDI